MKNNDLDCYPERSTEWTAAIRFRYSPAIGDNDWESLARTIVNRIDNPDSTLLVGLAKKTITAIFPLVDSPPTHEEATEQARQIGEGVILKEAGRIILEGVGVALSSEVAPNLVPDDELTLFRRRKGHTLLLKIDGGPSQPQDLPLAPILTFSQK